jgi:hypothetical protein
MRWFYYISSNIRHKYESNEPHSTGTVRVNLFSYQCSLSFRNTEISISVRNVGVASALTVLQEELVKMKIKHDNVCMHVCMYVCMYVFFI